MNNQRTREQIEQVEYLLKRFDECPDAHVRDDAAKLVQALMDIHGAGLGRIVDLLANDGKPGAEALAKLAADETVSGLLVLYGLHPVSFSERIRVAIEKLQPMLNSHDAAVELVSAKPELVHMRLVANGQGCHSGGAQLQQLIEAAILGAAPDLMTLQIEEPPREATPVFVPLQGLEKSKASTNESRTATV
jgi:Fe-S cluster biogenesis protein NfuA